MTGLKIDRGRVAGVVVRDAETGDEFALAAGCVVNATGVWVDAVRAMDRSGRSEPRRPLVAPSQGTHLVVGREFLPGGHALMVPRTSDGRVLFGVPWQGRVLLGTTDTPRDDLPLEPGALRSDVDFILGEAGRYLDPAPTWDDVRSAWVGLRPLVRSGGDDESTKTLSREHTVIVGRSGLVTVTGGKWTTYRSMAEDILAHCIDAGLLPRRDGGLTEQLPLVGAAPGRSLAEPPGEHLYGSEVQWLRSLPGARRWLWRDGEGGLTEAMVRFAVRHEMARTVEDVLARRSRLLFLDAREAKTLVRPVARLVADELGRAVPEAQVAGFVALAKRYFTRP